MFAFYKINRIYFYNKKNLIYYVVNNNNTKYCFIVSYLYAKSTKGYKNPSYNAKKLIKCTQKNRLKTKLISQALQDQLNEFILSKRLEELALHKHYEIKQNKRLSVHRFKIKNTNYQNFLNFMGAQTKIYCNR